MKDFVFVTGNQDKITLLEKFLGVNVSHQELDLPEVQSLDPKEVAEAKARQAYESLKRPVLVDDASLHITSLGGLPGPFVKFFLQTVGPEGVCDMVTSDDRSADAVLVFGLFDGEEFRSFDASIPGSISKQPRGDTTKLTKMGWNPIFIPKGQTKTVAEMTDAELEEFTPRGHAAKKLKAYLESS